jgi:hypothetical protein
MSVFSYRIKHVMRELNYWTDLMTRWKVGWRAGSENKAHGKMASPFAKPYISPSYISPPDIGPPDYDTVVFPSKEEISYWCSRALSMSTSFSSKATRRLFMKYRRSKSILAA